MSSPANPEAGLRDIIRNKRAILVAGTGVSIAASYDAPKKQPHPQASWVGLLKHGIEWLKSHDLMDADEAEAQLTLLKKNPQTSRFISAAEDITAGMGGAQSPHFARWLKDTIGTIKAKDRTVLDALDALRKQGHLLATTNYDGLLLGDPPRLNAVTWQETDAVISAVRDEDTSQIIFLHGYYCKPQSVILDWKSYEGIARHGQYREDLSAFWKTKVWVYIGCGVSGLNDPDLGLLLERYGERARQAGHWDYCLVCGDHQRHEFQAHFDSQNFNIRAVSYGEKHSDLAAFLHSLLPEPIIAPPPAPVAVVAPPDDSDAIPKPPEFYAEPDYIGSHKFVGRDSQMQELSDWAKPADPTNLLLFEAIGGNGKSMLTWEWTTNPQYALLARPADEPWAGRFWYSFYERGAIMADFCQRALAYMTGQPLKELRKKKTAELSGELLAQLHARPWLLILDGLERVLVAYHRIDAAEVPDEEVNIPTDKIANRRPTDAIRDEDNDLLRALASAAPSKILVSSRLTPRVLLNPSGQPINGAKRITLPGLRPPDAERLLRSCDIEGDSAAMQTYLATNCDNHPLVIGILGGLINNYLPARGDFDQWVADPDGGAKLDLGSLDIIQRRNHILRAALDALSPASRQLLSILALLSEAVDYETLKAFNPHLPPEPEEVEKPEPPEEYWDWIWDSRSDEWKAEKRREYEADLAEWQDYEKAVQDRLASPEYREAPKKLTETVTDLEQRGLLQYDGRTRRFDLHPVVRGVAAGGMKAEDKEQHGHRVIDHFSAQPHRPYEEAETMDDVSNGLHIVRTYLKLGHFQEAVDFYQGDLSNALFFNLEAYAEALSLLRPFFPTGWGDLPKDLSASDASYLASEAAGALHYCGELRAALAAFGVALRVNLKEENWREVTTLLHSITLPLVDQNSLDRALHLDLIALEIDLLGESQEPLFASRLFLFAHQSQMGQWAEAETTWQLLDSMGRAWSRNAYRPGTVERLYAEFHFWQGTLQEEHLANAELLAKEGNNRTTIRYLHSLRGDWQLEQGAWDLAVASYAEAVRLARERSLTDAESETGLALAKQHLGQLTDARAEAERLAGLRQPAHRYLAQLWLALDDPEQAKQHALAAYQWAWADGEPYANRYALTKTTELLQQMKVPIPDLAPYDATKDEPLPWEAELQAAIAKLRAEKEAEAKEEEESDAD